MAKILSFADLKRGALAQAGELQDGTSSFDAKAEEYLGRIYDAFLSGGNEFDIDLGLPWTWAKARYPGALLLQPAAAGLIVGLTQDSNIGSFSVAPTLSYKNWFLKVPGRAEYFQITAHTANQTSFTIDSVYSDETAASISANLYKLEYDLVDGIQRLCAPMRVYRDQSFDGDDEGKIYASDFDHMMREFPLHRLENGVPIKFAEVYRSPTGQITVRFNRVVSVDTKVEYDYIPYQNQLFVKAFGDTQINFTTGVISIVNSLSNGDIVVFSADADSIGNRLPTGLKENFRYYVVNASSSSFQVSATSGGSAIVPSSGSGSNLYYVGTEPVMPIEHRPSMEYAVAALLMKDKSDPRAQDTLALAQSKIRAIVRANSQESTQSSKFKGRLIPRMDNYSLSKRYVRQDPT